MEKTYFNPLKNFTLESIPTELISLAESRVAHANDESNGYKRGIETILISIQPESVKTHLRPNEKNIDTADTVMTRDWSYTVETITKRFKNGKVKSYKSTYFLYNELIKIIEIGGYKNPNNY